MWIFCFFLNIPFVFTFYADPLSGIIIVHLLIRTQHFHICYLMICTIVHCHFANEKKVKFRMKMLYLMFHSQKVTDLGFESKLQSFTKLQCLSWYNVIEIQIKVLSINTITYLCGLMNLSVNKLIQTSLVLKIKENKNSDLRLLGMSVKYPTMYYHKQRYLLKKTQDTRNIVHSTMTPQPVLNQAPWDLT